MKKDTIEVLQMIADDMKADAARFDGQPFNGKTVAEYFGNQGAAIAALAQILKTELQSRAAELPLELSTDTPAGFEDEEFDVLLDSDIDGK